MAEIPPWLDVRPAQFVQAAGAGAQAGLEAGGQFQRGQIASAQVAQETARTALAAQAQRDRVQLEREQLNQQLTIAQMETQARKDIAEKNAVRQSQELALQQAYREAQIDLHQRDLERQEIVADNTMREAAMAHQDQMGYAQARAQGMSNEEALFRFPRTPHSFVSSYGGGAGGKQYGPVRVQEVKAPSGELLGYAIDKEGTGTLHYESLKDKAQQQKLRIEQYRAAMKTAKDTLMATEEERNEAKRTMRDIETEFGIKPSDVTGGPEAKPRKDGEYYSKSTDTTYVIRDGKTIRTYKGPPKKETFEGSMIQPPMGPTTTTAGMLSRMG